MLFVPLFLSTCLCVGDGEAPGNYHTPEAVFNAYRDAQKEARLAAVFRMLNPNTVQWIDVSRYLST